MGVRESQLPRLLVIDVDGDRENPRPGTPQAVPPGHATRHPMSAEHSREARVVLSPFR
jgi:hypothetical protein